MKEFLKQWLKYFFFAGFFSLFVNLLMLTFPIYMLAIYDRVLSSYSMPTLITITIGAIMALLVLGLLDFFRSRLLVQAGLAMDHSLSHPVLTEMLKGACRIKRTGYTQGLKDVEILRNYFAGNAIFAFFDAPWTPIYIIIIYLMHPLLGFFALSSAILLFIIALLQELLTRSRLDRSKAISFMEQELIQTSMRNAETLYSMSMLDGVEKYWRKLNSEALRLNTEANRFSGLMNSVSKSFRPAMQVLIFGLGAYLVIHNESSAGIIIAASIIMRQALNPVEQAMGTWRQTIDARGAYKRLDSLIKNIDFQKKMTLPPPKGQLVLEGAALKIDEEIILNNISFSLQAGEQMGLIGPSGSGKTSLCRLLLGIWPPTVGTVNLDGADVFKWDKEQLGPHIGYLPQDIEFFSGTISENIARMGDVDPDKVIEAAQLAGIHEMILKLPNGYDTQIGNTGIRLSGGQSQRIGIARAFYGNPKLVILDEPNSNLDDAGEKALANALMHLKQNETTVIVVTHKPSLLNFADKVLMLQNGQIALFGPKKDIFQRLLTGGKSASQSASPPSASGVSSEIN